MNFYTVSLCVFALVSAVLSADLTPSGKVRPTIPKLYIVPAGPIAEVAASEMMLPSFRPYTVCTSKYPDGFSFRCDTDVGPEPDFQTVVFRVSRDIFHKEYKAPYFISENTREGIVKPFPYSSFPDSAKLDGTRLRIACRVRTRKPVWIDLITDETC